jgi:hypothetical protein
MFRIGTSAVAPLAVAVVLAGNVALANCPHSRWAISASETEPDVAWGDPSGAPTTVTLYLWLGCTMFSGVTVAEFGLEGTLPVLDFIPRNGFTNAGTPPNLALTAPGCLLDQVPVVAGEILVHDSGSGGTLCLGQSDNGWMDAADCDGFLWPMAYWGFTSDGTPLCALGEYEGGEDPCACDFQVPSVPTSAGEPLETGSWGRTKSRYR